MWKSMVLFNVLKKSSDFAYFRKSVMKKCFENGTDWRFKNAPLEGFLFKDRLEKFSFLFGRTHYWKGMAVGVFLQNFTFNNTFFKEPLLESSCSLYDALEFMELARTFQPLHP